MVGNESDATSAQARLDEAWRRVDLRDFEGARLLAGQVAENEPQLALEATYAVAVAFELEQLHQPALDSFTQIIATWPDSERAKDARFRIALTLADADQPKQAIRALRAVKRHVSLQGEAGWKVRLSEATWHLEAGHVRRGVKQLTLELGALPEHTLTWFEARARYAIVRYACEASKRLDFQVTEQRVSARLDSRAEYVLAARAQLGEIAELPEPYFILHTLMDLGDAYLDLGDDLRRAPVPRRLRDEQIDIYQTELEKKASMQFVKARRLYDLGRQHAGRVHWRGPEIQRLDEKMRRAERRLDADDG